MLIKLTRKTFCNQNVLQKLLSAAIAPCQHKSPDTAGRASITTAEASAVEFRSVAPVSIHVERSVASVGIHVERSVASVVFM